MCKIGLCPAEFNLQQRLQQPDYLPVNIVNGCRKENQGNNYPAVVFNLQTRHQCVYYYLNITSLQLIRRPDHNGYYMVPVHQPVHGVYLHQSLYPDPDQ